MSKFKSPWITLLAFIALMMATSPASALTGGPFDGGFASQVGADGTYSVSMFGENMVGAGTFQFSAQNGSAGRYSAFNRGLSSQGLLTASIVSGLVTGVMQGTVTGANISATGGGFLAFANVNSASVNFVGSGEFSTTRIVPFTVFGQRTSINQNLIDFIDPNSGFPRQGVLAQPPRQINIGVNDSTGGSSQ